MVLDEAVDQLRRHINQNLRVWTYDKKSSFVPITPLREHLDRNKIRQFLGYCGQQRHLCDEIHTGYLAIYVILLHIGESDRINRFLRSKRFADCSLPFEKLAHLPDGCDEAFFEKFDKIQWAFCAWRFGPDSLEEKWMDERTVIPFTAGKPLKKGRDSSTYKVSIHSDYNQLVPKSLSSTIYGTSQPTCFVVKTWPGEHRDLYENEVQAYSLLRHHSDIINNIPRFYGSWTHGDSCSILLEYVDGCKLSDIFNQDHPTNEWDTLQFWKGLVDITLPIIRLHIHKDPENPSQILSGIHQDIKSDNILVSQIRPGGRFNFNFKLADMGLAYIPCTTSYGQRARGRDRQGTQMFAAPECFRDEADGFVQRTVREATPEKDIWSLGCVYSDAAVWSVLGGTGRDEYEQLRQKFTDDKPNMRNTAYSRCFHDGKKVSEAVPAMHTRVLKERGVVNEFITIIEDMLKSEPDERPTAVQVRDRFLTALNNAQRSLKEDESIYPDSFQVTDEAAPSSVPKRLPRPSTQRPLRANTFTIGESSERQSMPQTRDSQKSVQKPRIPSPESSSTRRHDFDPKPPKRSVSESQVNPSYNQPSNYARSSMHATPKFPGNAQGNAMTELRQNPVVSTNIVELPNVSPVSSAEHVSKVTDPLTSQHTDSQHRNVHPTASISQVLNWIQSKKGRMNNMLTAPVAAAWLDELRGRDHIFVIDNSESMEKHRAEARRTFEALAYLVKELDPDGIEVHFTKSRSVGHRRHRNKLLGLFDGVKFEGQSSMEATLSRILEMPKRKSWSFPSLSRHSVKEKSVIVLTDGKWLGNKVDGMPELIKRQVTKAGSKRSLGIQFIQFGDDDLGTSRLRELDDQLEQHGVDIDIIDTEPHNGNVYKMLLGHFITSFDRLITPPKPEVHRELEGNGG